MTEGDKRAFGTAAGGAGIDCAGGARTPRPLPLPRKTGKTSGKSAEMALPYLTLGPISTPPILLNYELIHIIYVSQLNIYTNLQSKLINDDQILKKVLSAYSIICIGTYTKYNGVVRD